MTKSSQSRKRRKLSHKNQQKIEIDSELLDDIVCPNCGFNIFCQGTIIKRMSAVLPENPTGQTQYVHHQVGAVCIKCSYLMPEKP